MDSNEQKIDENLYSRQLYVLGHRAMQDLSNSKILLRTNVFSNTLGLVSPRTCESAPGHLTGECPHVPSHAFKS